MTSWAPPEGCEPAKPKKGSFSDRKPPRLNVKLSASPLAPQPRPSQRRSASQPPKDMSVNSTLSFVDHLRNLWVSLPIGDGWVTPRLHVSSVHPLRDETVRGRGELPVSPSIVLQSTSPSGSSRSAFGGSSSHVAPTINDPAGSTSGSESSSSSSASRPKIDDTPLGSSIPEDMSKKRKEPTKPDMDGTRRVVPGVDGSSKRTRVDGGSSSVLSEKQTDILVAGVTTNPVVTEDSEDAWFRFPLVVSVAEAGVDPATHTLVHGVWVLTAFAATYIDIVERGGGHMAKEGLLDVPILCYMTRNLLEIAYQLTRVGDDPVDEARLHSWEVAVQSVLNVKFPISWLKEMLVKVRSCNDPRSRLSGQISQLEGKLEKCSEMTSSKRVVLNLLLDDIGLANDEVLRAEAAEAAVRAELEEKRQELEKL